MAWAETTVRVAQDGGVMDLEVAVPQLVETANVVDDAVKKPVSTCSLSAAPSMAPAPRTRSPVSTMSEPVPSMRIEPPSWTRRPPPPIAAWVRERLEAVMAKTRSTASSRRAISAGSVGIG